MVEDVFTTDAIVQTDRHINTEILLSQKPNVLDSYRKAVADKER